MVTEACRQPGCAGNVEEGYCNVCGIAKVKVQTAVKSEQNGNGKSSRKGSGIITSTGSVPISRGAGERIRTRGASAGSARKILGAGLVSVPALPSTEPEQALLADAQVPEHKRFCSNCERHLTRERGFCGQCGQKYCFVPSLRPGEVIGGHYEVKGAIAYGGLGWIYLAFDRLLSRYVVLKGLLNTDDAAAAAVAVAERQFLAAVKHPNIVGIYSFIQKDADGFIVMEYVGGKTLRDIRRNRGPLPPAEAIAYIHRILDAFSYLHQKNLVYCDFKPENVMLERDDVKLIDLGGVRRIDDTKGDIYGTVGYSAPESCEGPSVETDLFTIGRTLAVLLTEIKGFGNHHRYSLPGPDEEPLFAEHESLYRFLLKATAEQPGDRFSSAEEMSAQLLGVLREIVALATGTPRPGTSVLFGGDMLALTRVPGLSAVEPEYRQLPSPILEGADAGLDLAITQAIPGNSAKRAAALREVMQMTPRSSEARLRLAGNLIDAGCYGEAADLLQQLEAADRWDWRPRWYRGLLLLASGKPREAQAAFDQVYFDLPGEIAPKLAFAMAAEAAGNTELAMRMYDLVSRTDPSFSSACFGLARCLRESGDRRAAVAALSRIPPESSLHACSQVEAARALTSDVKAMPGLEELTSAAAAIESLPMDVSERLQLTQIVLSAALRLLSSKTVRPNTAVQILGYPLRDFHLRQGLEKTLRAMAHRASGEEKIRLIDEANRVRPRTMF